MNLCDKDFAKLSGELSGAICLKILVLLGSALELFRKFFGAVRAIFWLCGSFFASEKFQDDEKGGLSLREVAVMTGTATTAETVETAKTVTVVSWHCIL